MLLGGSRNAIEMMRAPSAIRLPVRRKNGTPAHRQLSISHRRATNVSVSESWATPGSSRYPMYWPRTTSVGSIGTHRAEDLVLLLADRPRLQRRSAAPSP